MTDPADNADAPPRGRFADDTIAAALLLWGGDARVAANDGARVRRPWLALAGCGVAMGIALAVVWAAAANAFPWWYVSDLPLMPVAAVIAALALGPGRRMLTAPGELMEPSRAAGAALVTTAVGIILALGLLGIVPVHREGQWLPSWLAWIRPPAEYRVLLLMPMWGVWAMMVPMHFCRPAATAGKLVAAIAYRQPIAGTAAWMALALAASLWYLNTMAYNWALVPPAAALAVGSLGGIAICRAAGGVGRRALLAANLATQLAFLLGYLAAKTHLIS